MMRLARISAMLRGSRQVIVWKGVLQGSIMLELCRAQRWLRVPARLSPGGDLQSSFSMKGPVRGGRHATSKWSGFSPCLARSTIIS